MITEVYFVRHSKVDYTEGDSERKLSPQGLIDKEKVNGYFEDIAVDEMISSPYNRAIETIRDVAEKQNLAITIYDDLRERKVSNGFINNFDEFCNNQWHDFDYKLENGESFNEVKSRGIPTLKKLIEDNRGKRIIIGTHGTFLSIYLNHLDHKLGYNAFRKLNMPDIVKVLYDNDRYLEMTHIGL